IRLHALTDYRSALASTAAQGSRALSSDSQVGVAGLGLLLQQAQAQARAVDRIGVLPPFQRVARPAPGEAPFFSTTLSRAFEMRSPVRFSISSAKRGKVQFARSDTPVASRASITA